MTPTGSAVPSATISKTRDMQLYACICCYPVPPLTIFRTTDMQLYAVHPVFAAVLYRLQPSSGQETCSYALCTLDPAP